jgi:hypothetical protein
MYGPAKIAVLGDPELAARLRALVRGVRVTLVPTRRRLLDLMAAGRIRLAAARLRGAQERGFPARLARASAAAEIPVVFLARTPAAAAALGANAALPTIAIAYTISEIPPLAEVLLRRYGGLRTAEAPFTAATAPAAGGVQPPPSAL